MKKELKAKQLIPFLEAKNKVTLRVRKNATLERKTMTISKVESPQDDGTCVCTISTDNVDRGGDIMCMDGVNTAEFLKIPSVYVNHNYADLPAAKCLELTHKPHAIDAKVQFEQVAKSVSAEIWTRVKSGTLKGVIIGFDADEVLLHRTKDFADY